MCVTHQPSLVDYIPQVKTSSEKGWSNIQSYLKNSSGQAEPQEERDDGGRNSSSSNYEEQTEDLMKHDIDDLLGHSALGQDTEAMGQATEAVLGRPAMGQETEALGQETEAVLVEHPRGKKKKRKKKTNTEKVRDDGPPLISFDDEPVETLSTQPLGTKAKAAGTGYGSTGMGSSSFLVTKTNGEDWSGDWGEEWTGGGVAKTSGTGGDWGEDWNTEEGWNTVELKHD